MFGIALEISVADFSELLKDRKPILVGVFSQFLILHAITFLLVLTMKPIPSMALGLFMVATCSGGNISNFITHLAKGNTALSVSLTAVATMLAIVMTPLNLQLWDSRYEPTAAILMEVAISSWDMIKLVSLLLGIPLILGMWLNHLRPILAGQLAKGLKIGSLLFFIALLFMALYNNRDIFMDYVTCVFWLVVTHNLVAFITGFSLAKADQTKSLGI